MHAELLQIDAHHHIGIERLAHGGVVVPGIFVDPAGHFLLADHAHLANIAFQKHAHGTGEFTRRPGVAELQFHDGAADDRHMLAAQALEFSRHVFRGDQVGHGQQC